MTASLPAENPRDFESFGFHKPLALTYTTDGTYGTLAIKVESGVTGKTASDLCRWVLVVAKLRHPEFSKWVNETPPALVNVSLVNGQNKEVAGCHSSPN
jgi:hypothetical protein